MKTKKSRPQIKSIWGLAKSKELSLTDDDLYSIVIRVTGKDSLRSLTTKELNKVIATLINMKENYNTRPGMATEKQIYKIKEYEKLLGWSDNPKRLQAFMNKYYKVEKIEWLKFKEASNLIDSLKSIARKQEHKTLGDS